MKPEAKLALSHPAHSLSMGLGVGLMPWAPGTWGSLLALPLHYLLPHQWAVRVLAVAVLLVLALWCVEKTLAALPHQQDPQCIVIDETLGSLVCLSLVPSGWLWDVAALLAFRLYDITKPPPVNLAEKIPGAAGVIADDLVAGLMGAITIGLLRWL